MQKSTRKLLSIAALLIIFGGLLCAEAQAQGGIRLRLPFDGSFRLTSNVDHNAPGVDDGYMVVYHGEERLNCAAAYSSDSEPYCYDHHRGTDYSMYQQPVLAAASGTVSLAGDQGSTIGNAVYIDHAGDYQTRYYHLHSYSVNVGDEVSVGQQIGVSGNSGTGMPWHLHFEVRHEGYVTDPFGWRGDWADPIPNGPAVCLWGDGQCTAVIVEDESAWYYGSGGGWDWHHTGNSWTLRHVPNRSTSEYAYARWRPDLPYDGPYAVYAFVPSGYDGYLGIDYCTTTNAEYTITGVKGNDATVVINHTNYSDEWVYLGSYDFWDGIVGAVKLSDETGEANGTTRVCFDSIKFQQFRTYLPLVLKDYPPCARPIQNGGFEDWWDYWDISGPTHSTLAYSGSYSARLGGYNYANDTLYQTVTIPSVGPEEDPVVSVRLIYYWHMTTDEFSTYSDYDHFYARIRNTGGGTLRELEHLTNRSTEGAWVSSSFDVTEFKGQTVQVYFGATTDSSLPTSFYVDDVAIYACESD
jgi:hypothetical protein